VLSYQILENLLGFEKPLPVTEKWSAAPDFLKILSDYCLEHKPRTIVECSSGTSSLVLSRCCQLNQCGHVYSLENGEVFAKKTRQQLKDFSLSEYCDVFHAPLRNVQLKDESFQWYDLNNFPDIKIDLLVVDGPPGFIQKHSRYPALLLLSDMLAKQCTVFLDDAARKDEQEIVSRWLRIFPEFQSEYVENERGCSILRRS
jgi:predicted O-methyltransferase YrrM